MQNQNKREITFDSQLKTALFSCCMHLESHHFQNVAEICNEDASKNLKP